MDSSIRSSVPRLLAIGALAGLILLVIVGAHLFEPHGWSRNAKGLIRTFHAPGFAVVTLLLVSMFRNRHHGNRRYWYAAAAAMLAGVLSELAQLVSGRDADIVDLLRDAIGVAAGLGLAAMFDPALRIRYAGLRMWTLATGTAVAIIASLWGSAASAYTLWARAAALPKIASFANRWEGLLYEDASGPSTTPIVRPPDWPVSDDDVVLWTESTGRWRTFLHLRPYPDWRGYSAFSFVAASAHDRSYDLTVEVRDTPRSPEQPQNRVDIDIEATPIPKRFTIDFEQIAAAAGERAFDFEHVDIILVTLRSGDRGVILLDDFRLEP